MNQQFQNQQRQGGLLGQFSGGVNMKIVPQTGQGAVPTSVTQVKTAPLIMMSLTNLWNGNSNQVSSLLSLTYPDNTPIINIDRKDIIIEIISMLIKLGYEETFIFLSNVGSSEDLIWEQKAMDKGRNYVLREVTIHQAEEVGVKGVGRCRYCPSTELTFSMKQMRSADEPMTVFVRCILCQKNWKQ